MKISRELLSQMDLEAKEEREPVNSMRIRDILQYLESCALRIADKSEIYSRESDVEVQMDCIDIVTAKINDFTQAFRDIVIFLRKEEGDYNGSKSLRYCVRSYDSFEFEQGDLEKDFLKELVIRNEITHDYFNIDEHRHKLVEIMENCAEGAVEICRNLEKYCCQLEVMDKFTEGIR